MLEGLKPPTALRSCKVKAISDTLSAEDKAILLEATASPDWPIRSLSRALNERGLQISETPLSSHRAKACVCFKD